MILTSFSVHRMCWWVWLGVKLAEQRDLAKFLRTKTNLPAKQNSCRQLLTKFSLHSRTVSDPFSAMQSNCQTMVCLMEQYITTCTFWEQILLTRQVSDSCVEWHKFGLFCTAVAQAWWSGNGIPLILCVYVLIFSFGMLAVSFVYNFSWSKW